jgi:hypothetical protein
VSGWQPPRDVEAVMVQPGHWIIEGFNVVRHRRGWMTTEPWWTIYDGREEVGEERTLGEAVDLLRELGPSRALLESRVHVEHHDIVDGQPLRRRSDAG